MHDSSDPDALEAFKPTLRDWARELGFADLGFAPVALEGAGTRLAEWLARGFHGDMDYMARHGLARADPTGLQPGTLSVLSARMDYPAGDATDWRTLQDPERAYIARYARGRDYHKRVRVGLRRLAERMAQVLGPFTWRACADSAPIMEVELARRTGLGWEGKHTLLLSRSGSWFFLGELLCGLPFRPDPPHARHCGRCAACIDICPTRAIIAPYTLDARRCISYLTIEHAGSIPLELRPLIGNRIYGCDDCQLICPWNRHAQNLEVATDFAPRNGLDQSDLLALFAWDEAAFLSRFEGSPIRRIGHERWLRNLAVALGNAPPSATILNALRARLDHPSALLREHLQWAIQRHTEARPDAPRTRP